MYSSLCMSDDTLKPCQKYLTIEQQKGHSLLSALNYLKEDAV
jgi:hypothetical protein